VRRIVLTLWAAYLVAFPFYVAPSGYPQPSSVILVLLIAVLAIRGMRVGSAAFPVLRAVFWFVLYVTTVSVVWVIVSGRLEMLRAPLFYAYNGVILVVVAALYSAYDTALLRYTAAGISFSLFIQVALLPFKLDAVGVREALFFNNPNQLGYYAMLAGSAFAAVAFVKGTQVKVQAAVYASAGILVLASLSKAAIGAFALLVCLLVVHRPRYVLLLVAGAALFSTTELRPELVARAIQRVREIGSARDDSFAGRGYDRLTNHPEYLVLGAGEGAVDRFETELKEGELHSSWGTLLFSYGAVGLSLFVAICYRIYSTSGTRLGSVLLPAIVYGLTHQGLRSSMFWVSLGIVWCAGLHVARLGHDRLESSGGLSPVRSPMAAGSDSIR